MVKHGKSHLDQAYDEEPDWLQLGQIVAPKKDSASKSCSKNCIYEIILDVLLHAFKLGLLQHFLEMSQGVTDLYLLG